MLHILTVHFTFNYRRGKEELLQLRFAHVPAYTSLYFRLWQNKYSCCVTLLPSVYVANNGTDSANCSNCLTIAYAAGIAVNGDAILVLPGDISSAYSLEGTYNENQFALRTGVDLLSTGGSAITTVTCAASASLVLINNSLENRGRKIQGFTFRGCGF